MRTPFVEDAEVISDSNIHTEIDYEEDFNIQENHESDAEYNFEKDLELFEVGSIYPSKQGVSPFALQAKKQWTNTLRPQGWIGSVYGLVIHTTGGSLPGKAVSKKIYPSLYAMNYYYGSSGCHYINGWQGIQNGDLIQMANEDKQANGVGMSEQLASNFDKTSPDILKTLWRKKWGFDKTPKDLLPGTKTANSCYIHVECIPVVYHVNSKTITDSNYRPMKPGLRFTKEQHDTIAILAYDIANRNNWPLDQKWWRTPRLLGHEDLTPVTRQDNNGGWDPGGLRTNPYFDWEYVFNQIEYIYKNGINSVLKTPYTIVPELKDHVTSNSLSNPNLNINAPILIDSTSIPSSNSQDTTNTFIEKAIRLNNFYKTNLGWDQNIYQINDFLLPFSGQANVSLDEASFGYAVSIWQQSIGFIGKDVDGVIGPKTWKILSPLINPNLPQLNSNTPNIPFGFKLTNYKGIHGLQKSGSNTSRLDTKLVQLEKQKRIQITQDELDVLQRIANVETSGFITSFNSYDRGIVSIGFMQFTIHVNKIQEWIEINPAPWKKYGIELDQVNKYGEKIDGIKGVSKDKIDALRWGVWALSFYNASIDDDIIVSEVQLAKLYLKKHLIGLKSRMQNNLAYEKFINNYYNQDSYIRGLFQASYNNHPANASNCVLDSIIENSYRTTIHEFITIYINNLIKKGWIRLTKETSKGTSLIISQPQQEFYNANVDFEHHYNSYENYSNDENLYISEYKEENKYDEQFHENHTIENHNYESEDMLYDYEEQEDQFYYEENYFLEEDEIKDINKSISENRRYASALGWDKHHSAINDLLLPYSGLNNVSLGEEAFARALEIWQKQQGFGKNADGILGPNTWKRMSTVLGISNSTSTSPTLSKGPIGKNIFIDNKFYAQGILDSIAAGYVSVNTNVTYNPLSQLRAIVNGLPVLNLNPLTDTIQILPILFHICDQAVKNNFNDIVIGSFIRNKKSDGTCTGHCAGRCIDINFKGGNFSKPQATQMVVNILNYIKVIPPYYAKGFGFGLPMQGTFFPNNGMTKFKSTSPSLLIDNQLKLLVPSLGIVFPDNDNHLHIQVKWI